MNKIIIYQIFTRLYSNHNMTRKEWGSIGENGCGKLNDFTLKALKEIKEMGVSHVWFTGVIRHATATDYSRYGIPRNHPEVIKGRAGSPYAIVDYYDIDPDLAVDVNKRMEEFEALVQRCHKLSLKVIIDFVPNHVAREYHSIMKPPGVKDLGEDDDTEKGFDPQNNFYYCVGEELHVPNTLNQILEREAEQESAESKNVLLPYSEKPAKATGNDHFDAWPGVNDWYETVKLNYGVDYCDAGGKSTHFYPLPNTWQKMLDILLFWTSKGIDGFRCDMAEMVPVEFWRWVIPRVRAKNKNLLFIGEVYNPAMYYDFVNAGFSYLYDKVGMYDTMRNAICGGDTAAITQRWQETDYLGNHLLYFLENHDEQRIASDFFAGEARKGLPGFVVSLMMQKNPFMLYAGQEYGERGMDKEGFSGIDGRTTIFDYWAMSSLNGEGLELAATHHKPKGHWTNRSWTLRQVYIRLLKLARTEKTVSDGEFFDLMYVNNGTGHFDPHHEYAFLRKYKDEMLLVVANFSGEMRNDEVVIPAHAFEYLRIKEQRAEAVDLLTGEWITVSLTGDCHITVAMEPYNAKIYKFELKEMEEDKYVLNEHHKEEFPPAHTAQHLLNQTMVRMFGCGRSMNAHIERKKSKMTFVLDHKPSRQEEKEIERRMNELIAEDLPVTFEFVDKDHLPEGIDADRLPVDVSDTIRIVRIGDYDACPCIGKHVRSTSQIGRFEMLGTNWDEITKSFRIRFKIVQ